MPRARIETPRLSLRPVSAELASTLLRSPVEAEIEMGARVPESWVDQRRPVLTLRLDQMRQDPAFEEWLLWAVVTRDTDIAIAHVEFHGPPGINALQRPDALEVGYRTDPAYRLNGYAVEATRALIRWALDVHGVSHFLASIAPSNAPSLAVAARLGFVEITRVWDEEDGEEIVHELDLRAIDSAEVIARSTTGS